MFQKRKVHSRKDLERYRVQNKKFSRAINDGTLTKYKYVAEYKKERKDFGGRSSLKLRAQYSEEISQEEMGGQWVANFK